MLPKTQRELDKLLNLTVIGNQRYWPATTKENVQVTQLTFRNFVSPRGYTFDVVMPLPLQDPNDENSLEMSIADFMVTAEAYIGAQGLQQGFAQQPQAAPQQQYQQPQQQQQFSGNNSWQCPTHGNQKIGEYNGKQECKVTQTLAQGAPSWPCRQVNGKNGMFYACNQKQQ